MAGQRTKLRQKIVKFKKSFFFVCFKLNMSKLDKKKQGYQIGLYHRKLNQQYLLPAD